MSTYGVVSAGIAATIYFSAQNTAPSIFGWSTPASPETTFWLEVVPL
jgi:hypothetical protein